MLRRRHVLTRYARLTAPTASTPTSRRRWYTAGFHDSVGRLASHRLHHAPHEASCPGQSAGRLRRRVEAQR
jgi:hypothetical protein